MMNEKRIAMSERDKPTRYDSTRQAWENIWESASVEAELRAARSSRALRTMYTYAAYLTRDALILEAGSGLGAAMILLRQMGYRVIGLDYAVNALEAAQRYDASLPLLGGDVHALPFGDGTLGAYLSFGVLEHFEQGMMPALQEAHRVLQPGGVLVLTIPYPNIVYRLVQWRRRLGGAGSLADEHFFESTYTREDLIRVAVAAGFVICDAVPTSHAFTLWGLGGPFRARGYYETTPLANILGEILGALLPWTFNFSTLLIARKA